MNKCLDKNVCWEKSTNFISLFKFTVFLNFDELLKKLKIEVISREKNMLFLRIFANFELQLLSLHALQESHKFIHEVIYG